MRKERALDLCTGTGLTSGKSARCLHNQRALVSTVSHRVVGAALFDVTSMDAEVKSADRVDESSERRRKPYFIRLASLRVYYTIPHGPLHRNCKGESSLMVSLVLWDSSQ